MKCEAGRCWHAGKGLGRKTLGGLYRRCWMLALLLATPLALAQPVPLDQVESVAAGGAHTCAADQQRGVRCWGLNFLAQLGDGSRRDRLLPVAVAGLGELVKALAAGQDHSCALLDNGAVRCWGMNFYGQLGDGSTELGLSLVTPQGLNSGVRALAAGADHTCALTEQGAVLCWGANYAGQLGDGSGIDRLTPTAVAGLSSGVRAIGAGQRHSCAVLDGGGIRCWGFNFAGQLGDGSFEDRLSPVAVQGIDDGLRVAGGERFSCALRAGGGVSCWGANNNSQLGAGDDETDRSTPIATAGLPGPASAIDLGAEHGCALVTEQVYCWGRNDVGQLGDGTPIRRHIATPVQGLAASVTAIALGDLHSCARSAQATLQCWGLNFSGQLGDGSTTQSFVPLATLGLNTAISALDVGEEHSCALDQNGAVSCWGLNFSGQLGDGGRDQRLRPGAVSGLNSAVNAIDVGGFHACARRGGAALCWGRNDFGQLGDDSGLDQFSPVPVLGLDSGVSAISAGGVHSCAVQNGALFCWGHNFAGQLGDASDQRRFRPVPVVGLSSGVSQVASSFAAHTCALTSAGGLKCWGANERGQLGDGSTTTRLTPVDVPGLGSAIRQVALGREHSCALSTAGAVQCWGSNDNFQLGSFEIGDRLRPVDVPGLAQGVAQIALGNSHTCALSTAGAVSCFGRNDAGQIGDGTSLQRAEPAPVSGLQRDVIAIAAGAEHNCALLRGGAIRCWGSNYSGQFGNQRFAGSPTPVAVKLDRDNRKRPTPDGNAASLRPASDSSGRYLVFESEASNLIDGDSNQSRDVFRVDTHSGALQRVSLDNDGAQLGGHAGEAAISADGQRVLFIAPDAAVNALLGESAKARAKRQKGGQTGLFLRNMQTGTTQRIASTVSEGSSPRFAGNGGALVFTAINTEFSQGPTETRQVFLQPLDAAGLPQGSAQCVSCKSVLADGSDSGENSDGEGTDAVISADGQWVAWTSSAKNVLSGVQPACPSANTQVLLRNMQTGQVQTVSSPSSGGNCNQAGGQSSSPDMAFSGELLVFESDFPLVPHDSNQLQDVYLFDAQSNALTRLSETSSGADGNGASASPSIAGDGQTVVFQSQAYNLSSQADNNEVADIFSWSAGQTGLSRVSDNAIGDQADAVSDYPVLNFGGTQVIFESDATNLLLGRGGLDTNGVTDLFQSINPSAVTALKTATWWKEQESGWGLFIFDQGNLLAPAWFTYDDDGEPAWFLAGGAFPQADGSFRGDLFRFTGLPYNQIGGIASETSTAVGSLSLRFIGDQSLRFEYQVGAVSQFKQLTRFPFGPRRLVCRPSSDPNREFASNYSDVWWGGADQSGWGLFLTHVGDGLFAIWYTYDLDHEPLFLSLLTQRQADGRFSGQVFRQADGLPFDQIDNQPPSPGAQAIGTVSFEFDNGAHGRFSYQIDGVNQTREIQRLQVGSVASSCETVELVD
ncbi:PD40 domain-containing protein [Pseudomarimonas arenosa]|uniref:PD40 domain-containing protein n=1 Tax=Pseudomarimonas arenosa TaxID=2774145 RepID=A0AAW3ZMR5_9GAMM|nr:PD40 domain-containing protein [Pseudomarimonas arenosa]MBD8526367.1 PD40 domain-containing protein [Pseudomarimonas arenosa]